MLCWHVARFKVTNNAVQALQQAGKLIPLPCCLSYDPELQHEGCLLFGCRRIKLRLQVRIVCQHLIELGDQHFLSSIHCSINALLCLLIQLTFNFIHIHSLTLELLLLRIKQLCLGLDNGTKSQQTGQNNKTKSSHTLNLQRHKKRKLP